MHLLIPFASALSERGTQALRGLRLPNLTKLLTRLTPTTREGSDEYSLSTPHEQALAAALGWNKAEDGTLPWAARAAAQDDVKVGDKAWGLLSPVHWHVGADHVTLPDPQALHLSAQDSHTLFEAVKPLFDDDGWQIAWGAPTRWYASHPSLETLPCASIDRVIGRNIDLWMPTSPQAQLIRRLQNEVQMLLYQQPLNDMRVGQGSLPVNSFWLSGCGRLQDERPKGELAVANELRGPALASDWASWSSAWQSLDAGAIGHALERSQKGEEITVTLSGERFAQTFESLPRGLLSRIGQRLSPAPLAPVLEAL